MKYVLIQHVDGSMAQNEFETPNIVPIMEARGFALCGFCRGGHEQLQGQPRFTGLYGPFDGGPGVVRYEDEKSFNILSAD